MIVGLATKQSPRKNLRKRIPVVGNDSDIFRKETCENQYELVSHYILSWASRNPTLLGES